MSQSINIYQYINYVQVIIDEIESLMSLKYKIADQSCCTISLSY